MRGLIARALGRDGGLASRALISLFVKVTGAAATYFFLLFFSNRLGAVQFGIFAFVLSAANFGMMAMSLGQPMLTMRNLSTALAANNRTEARRALEFGMRILGLGMAFGILGMLVFGAVAPLLGAPSAPGVFLPGAILLAVMIAADFLSNVLRSFGSVTMALMPRDLLWRLLAPAAAAALLAMSIAFDAAGALWLNVATLGLLALIQAAYLARLAVRALRGAPRARFKLRRDWLRASIYFWGIAVSSGISQHLTVVAVGFSFTPEMIGAFFVAYRTASLLSMPLNAAELIMAPMIARHHAEGRREDLQRIVLRLNLAAVVPTLIGFVLLVLFGDRLLTTINPDYGAYGPVLSIFAFGFLVNNLTGPCGYVMMMTGAERTYLRYALATNSLGVIATGLLAAFGPLWAAGAVCGIILVQNGLAALWCLRVLGIDTTIGALRRGKGR